LLSVGSDKGEINQKEDPNSLSLLLEAEELNYEPSCYILNKHNNIIGASEQISGIYLK